MKNGTYAERKVSDIVTVINGSCWGVRHHKKNATSRFKRQGFALLAFFSGRRRQTPQPWSCCARSGLSWNSSGVHAAQRHSPRSSRSWDCSLSAGREYPQCVCELALARRKLRQHLSAFSFSLHTSLSRTASHLRNKDRNQRHIPREQSSRRTPDADRTPASGAPPLLLATINLHVVASLHARHRLLVALEHGSRPPRPTPDRPCTTAGPTHTARLASARAPASCSTRSRHTTASIPRFTSSPLPDNAVEHAAQPLGLALRLRLRRRHDVHLHMCGGASRSGFRTDVVDFHLDTCSPVQRGLRLVHICDLRTCPPPPLRSHALLQHTRRPRGFSAPLTLSKASQGARPFFAQLSTRLCMYLTPHSSEQYFENAPRAALWHARGESGSGARNPYRQRVLYVVRS